MTVASLHKGLVLAIHPTARGFGWVLFEAPLVPIVWGMASAKQGRNERLLRRFERIVNRYEPSVLVLEEFEGNGTRRMGRVQLLCRALVQIAATRGMETPVYRRTMIQTMFASVGAVSRHEIAEVIRQQIDAFSHRMPRKRKPWESEDSRQSLFDAAALAITYFALTGDPPG